MSGAAEAPCAAIAPLVKTPIEIRASMVDMMDLFDLFDLFDMVGIVGIVGIVGMVTSGGRKCVRTILGQRDLGALER
jgi:hypothetical protein